MTSLGFQLAHVNGGVLPQQGDLRFGPRTAFLTLSTAFEVGGLHKAGVENSAGVLSDRIACVRSSSNRLSRSLASASNAIAY